MFSKTARLAAALSLTAAATVTATGTAAAQTYCQDIGNGNFCMSVDGSGEGESLVTLSYRKYDGDPVTVRLAWWYYAGDTSYSAWLPAAAGDWIFFYDKAAPSCLYGKMDVQGGPTYYLDGNPICPG
ncbi:hypothetical protein F4560_002929 [Saccharothrix ecbatanensis]|uniref:Peptidase inhibitor family I36 n=1 Tax=Saccharothrix ecbatanensis TaxID=1105145 RepID=A0A7W9HJD7_9PSEU|nr:hypothetical protein [Saccharothrix ecbatanensis]MBB5803161.1 hypothetical protein [Saccharothrix ecbatanensis]